MRRICLALLLMLCLMIPNAQATQEYTLGDPQSGDYYTCMDFDGEMPMDVAEIFSSLLREGDEVLCGSRGQLRNSNIQSIRQDTIVMAVRREGKILLLGACRDCFP